MHGARVPLLGAVAAVAMVCGSVGAYARNGMIGLDFGPWWGPYDAYAPPAYAYPPPTYAVPPPPPTAAASQAMPEPLGGCRELESAVIVDGQTRMARGLACPQPDGSWRIVR